MLDVILISLATWNSGIGGWMYRRAAIQEYGEMREQRVEQEKVQRHTIQNDRDLFRGHPRLYTAEQLGSLATNPYLGLTPEQAIVMLAFDADGNLHTPVSYNEVGAVVSDPVRYTSLDVVTDLIAQQGDSGAIDPAMFDPQYVTMIGKRYIIDSYEQRDEASQTINYAPKPHE